MLIVWSSITLYIRNNETAWIYFFEYKLQAPRVINLANILIHEIRINGVYIYLLQGLRKCRLHRRREPTQHEHCISHCLRPSQLPKEFKSLSIWHLVRLEVTAFLEATDSCRWGFCGCIDRWVFKHLYFLFMSYQVWSKNNF